jgi:hypothetical protein
LAAFADHQPNRFNLRYRSAANSSNQKFPGHESQHLPWSLNSEVTGVRLRRWSRTNPTSRLTSHFNKDAPIPDTQVLTISFGADHLSGRGFYLWPSCCSVIVTAGRSSWCLSVSNRSLDSAIYPNIMMKAPKPGFYGKLFIALLTEKLIQHACAVSPPGLRVANPNALAVRGVNFPCLFIRLSEPSNPAFASETLVENCNKMAADLSESSRKRKSQEQKFYKTS